MSTRTSYRRRFAMAIKHIPAIEQERPVHCPHSSTKWIYEGHHAYKVCQRCGEIVKEETRYAAAHS